MKKFFGVLAVLAVTAMISSSVFAAKFTKSITASATFAGSASISFDLFNVSGDSSATALSWNDANAFNMDEVPTWVAADQYAKVVANITKANAFVYMYTENKVTKPTLQPDYNKWNGDQGVAGTETYGGLVRTAGQGEANGGSYRGYIPVLFSYVATKGVPTLNVNSTTGEVTPKSTKTQADRFLSDKANGEYDQNYTIIAALNGPTFGYADGTGADGYVGPWTGNVTNNTAYMYFFGGFKNIIGEDVYSTTIKVESSWE